MVEDCEAVELSTAPFVTGSSYKPESLRSFLGRWSFYLEGVMDFEPE